MNAPSSTLPHDKNNLHLRDTDIFGVLAYLCAFLESLIARHIGYISAYPGFSFLCLFILSCSHLSLILSAYPSSSLQWF